jgi:predicted SnoaL-like aldol condensation-catalyzing enzyme
LRVADGLAGFRERLESLPKGAAKVNTVRVLQDGNFVFAHTESNVGGPRTGFDIFRFQARKDRGALGQPSSRPPSRARSKRSSGCVNHGSEGGEKMKQTIEAKNKAIVLEAFETLFNKRDYTAAERYWSPDYIQHSAHIAPGREGLFNLIKSLPPTLKYQPGTIVAEGEFVIVHGRFSGFGAPVNWIAADIIRIQNGILVEHWDVIQDEATEEQSISKRPMFGKTFPTYK